MTVVRAVLSGLFAVSAAVSTVLFHGDIALARHTSVNDVETRLQTVSKTWGLKPVDARVDRVWHAIPGLCGWQLDIPSSLKETKARANDGIHLKWISLPPAKSLKNLPAEPIYRGPSQEKSASLMFNVSWGEAYVPGILRTLQQYKVHATFFLDGDWVLQHPDLVRRIFAEGHVIGSHGSGHPDFRHLTNAGLAQQLDITNARIKKVIDHRCLLVAPPGGAYDARLVRVAKARGMYTILWTVDTIDWRRPPADQIVARVMTGAEPGMLVLMHPTAPTESALPALIRGLQQRGYRFKTVEQVVNEESLMPPDHLE